jgi:hypothetical protein
MARPGLREIATRAILSVAARTGVTVISTKKRDRILESAPWLASYFMITEKTRRQTEKRNSGADAYLRYDNPRLEDLRRRYGPHPANDHIQWDRSAVESAVDLPCFRADNLYVFQSRRYPPLVLYATSAYTTQVDQLGLMDALEEDDEFGVETFNFHGKVVSRDLLDSIIEINFLSRHLGFLTTRAVNVLDVGAGYGRLAHRMASALPNLSRYYCIDAVPESTFISDYYLKFRQMTERCVVVPLDKFGEIPPVDLAINIHSFAECRSVVIDWWLQWLRELRVPWLFIATHPSLGLTAHEDHGRKDFRSLIERSGFVLVTRERKFESAPLLQVHGLYPADYYLFRRG